METGSTGAVFLVLLLAFCLGCSLTRAEESAHSESCDVAIRSYYDFSEEDLCALDTLRDRCTRGDACMLRCLASRAGEGIGGGCYHLCAEHGTSAPPGQGYREPETFYRCYWQGATCELPHDEEKRHSEQRLCEIAAMQARCNALDACFVRCETSRVSASLGGLRRGCRALCVPNEIEEQPRDASLFTPPEALERCSTHSPGERSWRSTIPPTGSRSAGEESLAEVRAALALNVLRWERAPIQKRALEKCMDGNRPRCFQGREPSESPDIDCIREISSACASESAERARNDEGVLALEREFHASFDTCAAYSHARCESADDAEGCTRYRTFDCLRYGLAESR